MKPARVTSDHPNLTDLLLDHWTELHASPAWDALRTRASALFPQTACYWEFHPNGQRIDLCCIVRTPDRRARLRLRNWAQQASTADIAHRAQAARALLPWIADPSCYDTVGWEEDDNAHNGVGIFATVLPETTFEHVLATASQSYALSDDIYALARAFKAQVDEAFRLIAVGSFFGRPEPAELRLILRPQRDDWLTALPPELRAEAEELLAALPAETDVNLALSLSSTRIALGFESRWSPERVPNAAWAPWLAKAFPDRQPLHEDIITQMLTQPLPIIPAHWPPETLLDAYARPSDHVPVLDCSFSHVKVQRDRNGVLVRKLYLLIEERWRQFG